MIAKIRRSSNLFGALSYNNIKVQQEKGKILFTHKIVETSCGEFTIPELMRSFEPYLLSNRKTEKHTLHISINPDPKDKVSNEQFKQIAEQYMQEMGYGDQPFIVFKHTDIERSHIHIVSVCIDDTGKKISDSFEKIRSMKACRKLEKKFGLLCAVDKVPRKNDKIFQPVDYVKGNIKSQISSVIRHLPQYYQFQSLGEYNALLSLFNITTEKVEGKLHGKLKKGLLYFPLNESGKKTGSPLKASLIGKNTGIDFLEKHFEYNRTNMKNHWVKSILKSKIGDALHYSKGEQDLKKQLADKGIDMVVRRNEQGRIYGMTFIDHHSKTIWNGSRLGKEFSASSFNDCWNNTNEDNKDLSEKQFSILKLGNLFNFDETGVHHLFDFSNTLSKQDDNILNVLSGLLPEIQEDDYEEIDFMNKMKRKKNRFREK
ncbi:conjugal transfer protein MobB [Chryseobacterium sediminis]|jgi:hypothetical protein|uniref:conjugal transfer protein MobB n=1 Tax=Chryseobacterium sediminis TaxID=1679494 RepID=UPI002858BD3F|nr:conjugal transfer protein MobB [Chryseobacterium sediminis]MDR6461626.1 hypothetical protein [Chryseobacterium sediminis]